MNERIDTEHKIILAALLLVLFSLPFYLRLNHINALDGNSLLTAAGTVSGTQQPAPQSVTPVSTLGQTAGRSFIGSNL